MNYQLKCKCGTLSVELDSDCSFLRMSCGNCKEILINYQGFAKTSPYSNSIFESKKTILYKKVLSGDEEKQVIGQHYQIIRLLGVGGYARVYLARDIRNNKLVALKKMQKVDDPKAIDYFLRESIVLRELQHPNIISFYGVGNDNGIPFIVTEYVEGKSLEEIIKSQTIPILQAIHITYSTLEALKYAAQKNMIHRDIKPSNILLTKRLHVKIIDMGISKMLNESYDLTNTSDFLGTIYYMPFEQIRFCKDVNNQVDIYAVGATLYDMIARVPPFVEHDKSFEKIIAAKTLGQYIRLKERCPDVPDKLADIIEKAMAHKIENRYQDVQEMQSDLKKLYQLLKEKAILEKTNK